MASHQEGVGNLSSDFILAGEQNITSSHHGADISENEEEEDFTGWGRPPLFKRTPLMIAVFTIAYAIVFVLAVVNNTLVVTVIFRNIQLRTITNYFLANLAIADIMVSFIVLPLTLLDLLFTEWQFGAFLCKITPYLQAVAVGASVNTLAAVALERYLAIFYPQSNAMRHSTALVVVGIIWLVPVCIQIPWAISFRQETFTVTAKQELITLCYPKNSQKGFFLGVVFLTCYFIPLLIISVFYSLIGARVWRRSVAGIKGSRAERNINRSKIRVVRMLILVTVVFAFCWLPLYAIKLQRLFGPRMSDETKAMVQNIIFPIAKWLGSATSCMNPFIYCYFSEQFRKSIMILIKGRSCRCSTNL